MRHPHLALASTAVVVLTLAACSSGGKHESQIDWTKYQIQRTAPSDSGPVGNPGSVTLQGPDVTEGGGVQYYVWSFGDGQGKDGSQVPGHGLNASHIYDISNQYTAQVVVVLKDGRRSPPISMIIEVDLLPPRVDLGSVTLSGQLGEPATVTVNGVADQDGSNTNLSWSCTIDLGTTGLPADPGPSSTNATDMDLTVQATDPSGNAASQVMTVVVNPLD